MVESGARLRLGPQLAHFGHKNPAGSHTQIDVRSLVEYATRLDKDGMNVSFWWSLDLFTGNKTAATAAWCGMPRLDSIFFPGGDGGALVWSDIQAAAGAGKGGGQRERRVLGL